jgi:uncharacterized protein (TIGR02679 family)
MLECTQGEASLERWLCEPHARAWIRTLAGRDIEHARQLMQSMFAVLARLPAKTPTLLAQFAADFCGDSHALDRDTRLGRLTTRALAGRAECTRPTNAKELRVLWASAGVVLDELSATVLVLNLPAKPGTPLGDVLCRLRLSGEPCRLTFRQLRGESPCEFSAEVSNGVFVCENPAVVSAAADRWGSNSKPLVCVEGQPNLAAERLLHLLVRQGFSLHYHGDFDWGGIRIAARLWELLHFLPWRFRRDDYLQAPPGRALSGTPAIAPWDNHLAPAMEIAGRVVHEEAVLDCLLGDLAVEPPP